MTVLTGDAVSEAQQSQVPPVFRRLATEHFEDISGFDRYNNESIMAGIRFRCSRGAVNPFVRGLQNHFDSVHVGNIAHRPYSVMIQIRFR